MHTHTAFLSSSISAPLLLLRLSLALPHLLPSAHPHRLVRSAARLPPPRRPPCRASPHSRLAGPRLAPPRPFALPASTPTLPRPPFPDPFASPLLHLSPAVFSATVTLFLPWPRVFRATSLSPIHSRHSSSPTRTPVPFFSFLLFFFLASPLPSCAYFSTSFPSACLTASLPSSTPFDPRYYILSPTPSLSVHRRLVSTPYASRPFLYFFLSFLLLSSSMYMYVYILYICIYIYTYSVSFHGTTSLYRMSLSMCARSYRARGRAHVYNQTLFMI